MKKNTNQELTGEISCRKNSVKSGWIANWPIVLAALFFVVEWAILATYDSSTLARIEQLSSFFYNDVFFDEMMSVPAGFLSYLGCFLVQFFYYPALGAAIYALGLYVVYRLTIKVFEVPRELSLLALLPVALLLATNTQLGYWIFYLKIPGYYFVALLGVMFSLLAMALFKKLSPLLQVVFVVVWTILAYPLMGVYALVSSLLMGVCFVLTCRKKSIIYASLAFVLVMASVYFVPRFYYNLYTTVPKELLYFIGVPCVQWREVMVANVEHLEDSYWHSIIVYWIPFFLLLAFYVASSVISNLKGKIRFSRVAATAVALVAIVLLHGVYWFNDRNFRIENKQNRAMWEQDWRSVADYAMEADVPTRQVVMNKNIALLKLGTVGSEMFSYPDGSSDINAPMAVHLTQTGGKMAYFQYGKFNYCYRWCVEDAVEYGWRFEYLKHAVRSMILAGEYVLAQRYIDILKQTLFHASWANEMEKFVNDPDLISKEGEFAFPLSLACYTDALDVDDSFVEAFLIRNFKNIFPGITPEYLETALSMCLIRKDAKMFWYIFNEYLKIVNPKTLPRHYQEAFLLFYNLDKGKTITVNQEFFDRFISRQTMRRFEEFLAKTKLYKGRGMKEDAMAPNFKGEFGDTYLYFYFFVRKIRTN
jgi:hypothetical protein